MSFDENGLDSLLQQVQETEEKIQAYVKEINSVNKKLEAYSYAMSHDLKEPLRTIRTYSEMLSYDYVNQLDEKGKLFVDRIVLASSRMIHMIDDLLLLAQVGKEDISFKQVPIATILQEVSDSMGTAIKEKQCSIITNELPELVCQPVWIRAVFQNLISNSLKYSDKESINVEITWQELAETHEFTIKDNGRGIPEHLHDRIFKLFRKAHQDESIEGSGAGLAIVTSAIEQHNGKVWVDWSKPGEGTAIKFTIQKNLDVTTETHSS